MLGILGKAITDSATDGASNVSGVTTVLILQGCMLGFGRIKFITNSGMDAASNVCRVICKNSSCEFLRMRFFQGGKNLIHVRPAVGARRRRVAKQWRPLPGRNPGRRGT